MSLHSTELPSAGMGSSVYRLRVDPKEITAYNNSYIVVMGGCLEIAQILLICLLAITKQCMFLLAIVV
jgi:hypothetical protein